MQVQGLCILFSQWGEITKRHQPFAVLSPYGHILCDHPFPTSTTTTMLWPCHWHSTMLVVGLLLLLTTVLSAHCHITTQMMPLMNGIPRTANEGRHPCHRMWHGHWQMVSSPTTCSPSNLLTHVTQHHHKWQPVPMPHMVAWALANGKSAPPQPLHHWDRSPTSCSTTTNNINEEPRTHITEWQPAPKTAHLPHAAPPRMSSMRIHAPTSPNESQRLNRSPTSCSTPPTTSTRIRVPTSMNDGQNPCHVCWYGHWQMVSKLPHDPFTVQTAHPCHTAPPQTTSMRNCAPTSPNGS